MMSYHCLTLCFGSIPHYPHIVEYFLDYFTMPNNVHNLLMYYVAMHTYVL